MIPYPYNMVDMGGIDLAEANGTVVEGLYAKIVEAVNDCGDVVLYNWKFAGIEIAPQHTQILLGVGVLTINTLIQVTEQDAVTVLGIAPPPPIVPVEPLNVFENGVYTATPPASGFNPITVAVPDKALIPLSVAENGEYDPSDYSADGFNLVTVDVAGELPTIPNAVRLNPYSEDNNTGYVNVNNWYAYQSNYADARTDIYELNPEDGNTRYFLIFVAAGGGNRFRIALFDVDPASLPSGVPQILSGSLPLFHTPTQSATVSDGGSFTGGLYQVTNITTKKYLCIGKTNANISGIKSYVVDITNTP